MKLKEWLDTNEIKYTKFAALIPASYGTLWNIFLKGTHSLKIALRIEELTLGAVTCKELLAPELEKKGSKGRRRKSTTEKTQGEPDADQDGA